jgi:hypothetical protein
MAKKSLGTAPEIGSASRWSRFCRLGKVLLGAHALRGRFPGNGSLRALTTWASTRPLRRRWKWNVGGRAGVCRLAYVMWI